MLRAILIYAAVFFLCLLLAPNANAGQNGDVLLTCVAERGQDQAATQWEIAQLETEQMLNVGGTAVALKPYVLWGSTYVQIATDHQDDQVVAKWGAGRTREMDNGVRVTCYFQHDD